MPDAAWHRPWLTPSCGCSTKIYLLYTETNHETLDNFSAENCPKVEINQPAFSGHKKVLVNRVLDQPARFDLLESTGKPVPDSLPTGGDRGLAKSVGWGLVELEGWPGVPQVYLALRSRFRLLVFVDRFSPDRSCTIFQWILTCTIQEWISPFVTSQWVLSILEMYEYFNKNYFMIFTNIIHNTCEKFIHVKILKPCHAHCHISLFGPLSWHSLKLNNKWIFHKIFSMTFCEMSFNIFVSHSFIFNLRAHIQSHCQMRCPPHMLGNFHLAHHASTHLSMLDHSHNCHLSVFQIW